MDRRKLTNPKVRGAIAVLSGEFRSCFEFHAGSGEKFTRLGIGRQQ
jgi:hypothetical protein